MFNPLYPFTKDVLEATIKRGCMYFVRNDYPNAIDHFNTGIKAYLLYSHYDDYVKALAHYNAIPTDHTRRLYDWNNEKDIEDLKLAASQPKDYKIYSAYFLPDYKNSITPVLKEKINKHIYLKTMWQPKKGNTIKIDFNLQFGSIFINASYAGYQLKVKFADIENLK
jgi:hypothetical protein